MAIVHTFLFQNFACECSLLNIFRCCIRLYFIFELQDYKDKCLFLHRYISP